MKKVYASGPIENLSPEQRRAVQARIQDHIDRTNLAYGYHASSKFIEAVTGMVERPELFRDVAPEWRAPVEYAAQELLDH